MIENDHVNAALLRKFRRFNGSDPAIHGHNALGTVFDEPLYRGSVDPVSLGKAIRLIAGDILPWNAKLPEKIKKQRSAASPIHIVIAINDDLLTRFNGCCHAIHGFAHINDQERIRKLRELRLEKKIEINARR